MATPNLKYPSLAVLIPIYKEKEKLLWQNFEVFSGLNYPGRLKVYWLLHDSDDETIDSVIRVNSELKFTIIIDHLNPPLKANALNNALKHVEGEVIAVFDVDSIVSSDFIEQGVSMLLENPELALTQGMREYYNKDVNALTYYQQICALGDQGFKPYACEITKGWFPLAGTGYFIWKKDLEEVDGWSQTVTEDVDLGTKLYKYGKKMAFFSDVSHYEECPETLLNWMRQQIRWKKGYAQLQKDYDLRKIHPFIVNILEASKWHPISKMLIFFSWILTLAALSLLIVFSSLTLIIMVFAMFTGFVGTLILCILVPYLDRKIYDAKVPKIYGGIETLNNALYPIYRLLANIQLKLSPYSWYHTKKRGISNLMEFLRRLLK